MVQPGMGNAGKIGDIPALLAEWEGEEDVLLANIKEKYGVVDHVCAPRPESPIRGT